MSQKPVVINLKGKKHIVGDCCQYDNKILYCGRQCYMGGWKLSKSKWANPFSAKQHSRDGCIKLYEDYIRNSSELFNQLSELSGKKLACWCSPQPCHCNVLVKLWEESDLSNTDTD